MADLKISELASANVVNKDDLFYLIQDNDSYNVKASTLFSSITDPTLAGNILLGGTVQTLNAAGTVSITTTRTDLYGGRSADANAISNGSILPSTIFLYTEDVSATGRGFTFANGTPTTQTLYVRYKNDKIHLSQADSTVFTYPPEDWVGPTGLRPFPTGLQFVKGSQYIFNVSDPSNTGNVLALSSSIDGTNTLGTRYTANVVYNGTPGTAGANVVFTVANVDIDPGGKFYLDLPQGADGQLKIINLVTTLGGQFVLASNIQNNLAIELKRSGDSAFLMYSSNGWILVGSNPGLTTTFSGTSDDISEGSKLYFTNARARAAITAIDNTITYYKANGGIAANIQAITENIVAVAFSGNTNIINEGSENLYYTNNRVLSNVSQMSINVLADVDTTGITSNGTLIWNGTSFVAGIANEAYSAVVSNVSQTSNIANVVLTIDTFSTSNLREGSNLYYTNARVYANVIPLLDLKANVVDLTTANVAELNNLYYTNARVISALVGQDIVTNNVIIQGDLTVEGNVVTFNTATLTVEDKNIVLANGAINSSAADGSGFNIDGAQANLKYRSTGDKFEFNKSLDVQGTLTANGWANLYAANVIGLTTANVAELTNLYYTNARVYSNVTPLLDLKANVVDLTTSNIAELTNLYYTNSRVYANVIGLLNAKANVVDLTTSNVVEDINLYYTNVRVYANVIGLLNDKANVVDLTTSNVVEDINLYYTNARVYANVIGLLNAKANVVDLTTSNVVEGSSLYYTNARVYSNVIGLLNAKANVVDLTTSNVVEGNNSYYTNARVQNYLEHVDGNILPISSGPYDIGSETYAWRDLWLQGTSVRFVNSGSMSAVANTFRMVDASGNVIFTANSTNIPITSFDGKLSAALLTTVPNYSTSNISEGSNLYYTNARVYANVIGLLNAKANVIDLTTSNVAELNNLYYTNARVYANIIGLLNVKANVLDLTTSNVVEGNNLYYTNARVNSQVQSNLALKANVADLNTSNVIEGDNLYYTNARVYANVIPLLDLKANVVDLTTANVIELTNLYYTNARVYSNVIGLLNAKANVVDLTTSNVVEGNNLYYTNTRVSSNIIGLLPSLAGLNISIEANGQISAILSTAAIGEIYTSNVIENGDTTTGNVYFSNARARAVISAGDDSIIYDPVTGTIKATNVITANVESTVSNLTTANIVESASSLYFSNARARAAISAGTGVTYDKNTGVIAIGQNVNTTANVTFGTVNITGNLNVLGNTVGFYANNLIITDPLIQLGFGNPSDSIDLGFISHYNDSGTERHAGLFRDATDKKFKFFDNYSVEPGDTTLDTAHPTFRLANVVATTFEGNVVGNVAGFVSSIRNFTTSNLAEGANLYYTNARVYSNVISVLNSYATVANLNLKANVVDLTTANVVELTNLYYTNARVYSNVIDLLNAKANVVDLTTSNVVEGSSLYYTNARVYANVSPLLDNYQTLANAALKANISDLTTSNVVEDINLYYTNARVYANVIGLLNDKVNPADLTTANVRELAGNLYYTNARVYSNVISLLNAKANVADLNTSNIIEGTNLYYTNARVYANVISLLPNYTGNITAGNATIGGTSGGFITGANLISTNIISAITWIGLYAANVAGLTTANVTELNNLYYTNARVYSNVISLLNAKANVTDLTTANIIENTNLYYTNARVLAGLADSNLVVNDATIKGNLYVEGDVVTLNTATLAIEDKNIILANGAINSTAADGAGFNIDGAQANLKYHNTGDKFEFNKSLDVLGTVTATTIYSNTWNNLFTSNVIEGANLYYTVIRANAAIDDRVTKSFIDNLGVSSSSAVFAENANVANTVLSISNFTTSNLIEGANLYYTNARVYSNVISLLNAKADVTDLTTSNVVEGNNLYYTNTRVHANVVALLPSVNVSIVSSYQQFVSDGATTVYTLSTSVPNESSIFVIIDGLTQIPSLDYTASGTTLSLLTVPANQSNVVVRYFSATLSQ